MYHVLVAIDHADKDVIHRSLQNNRFIRAKKE